LDKEQLSRTIKNVLDEASENQVYFVADNEMIEFLLGSLLKPNVEYDEAATQSAKEDAANQIRNNPIMIHQGMRIVSQGDIITEDVYDILVELNLTDVDQFDWQKFSGIALMNLVLMLVVIIFFRFFYPDLLLNTQTLWAIIISLFIPLIISYYSTNIFPLSPPIYFSAIIICAYFDLKSSVLLSTVLAFTIYPMTSFNSYFLPVVLVGSIVAASFARRIIRENNYMKLILATTISSLSIVLALSILQEATLAGLLKNVMSVAISSMVSVILAIGVMPIFELIFNSVSPIKIIELSQPGQPLMKRLFTEAPGTSQHSMMVANLADAGCEAIGADTNLVRVGAYYHDIGKLENPMMFTENQTGDNPHDRLTPEESTQILTAHTEDGLKLGRQYRLPEPVLKMIHEHHGTTVLQFFYHKACQLAEQEGREKPDKDLYRYHNPLPSFRESAVLMLADSVEAAIKSSEINDIKEAENFMRNIFKIKIDQNQLVNSGLSFRDVEAILQAFVQVYSGQFHKRVKYPNQDNAEASTPAKVIP
ncbi:MAG TPA: HDIG domain-containing protein, partial [Candidatus Eisenbacteria bacterium]|nr:HDIG domain-containing protein [Candidatus Eisenbacteria bacterium]